MIVVFFLCTIGGYAQSVGDRLFAQGQKLQMVQTVKSQNLAISKFIAAQKAYDSSAKKACAIIRLQFVEATSRR